MNVKLNDSGVPILKQKTFGQKVKSFLLWAILVILTLAAALLVYLCIAGASEMAALTTLKQVSNHPYYTMTYENFDYSDMVTKELGSNDAVIKYYKSKFFSGLSGMFPGENKNDYATKGSIAFYGRSYTSDYMKGRMYNSYDVPILMVTAKPENGYKSWNIIDMTDVGLSSRQEIDAWFNNSFQTIAATYCVSEGINSELFSVSLISCPVAECDDTPLVNITPFMAVRLMLDRAATVDSAIELLSGYDIDFSSGPYHFLISEKSGNSAIVEYVNGKMSVTYPVVDTKTHHQICTNKMEDKTVRTADKDYSDRFQELSLYRLFDSTLSNSYSSGLGQAPAYMDILMADKSKALKETNEEHFGTNMYGTQYTVLYDFFRMKMHIVIGGDTKAQSYTYDLTV